MGKLSLGIDLGSNSLGWALIDEERKALVRMGVRVFPEGVDRDKQGGEKSKNETRRVARGMRRQIARRARRRRALRHALINAGLLPEAAGLPIGDAQRVAFDGLDPYELRRRALVEKLAPHELGRLLIHISQRRGFKSNRKQDRKNKKENSAMLEEISELANKITASGHQTIGQHLASIRNESPLVRIRGKHTRRDMYEQEFDKIWQVQSQFHPNLLSEKLKHGSEGRQNYPIDPKAIRGKNLLERFGLHGLIFFQRPLYWPASVIGHCELEPRLKRAPRADRRVQRYRLLTEVNNLRILDNAGVDRPLTPEQRDTLIKALAPVEKLTFDQIRKKLDLLENTRFNLQAGDRDNLKGITTDAVLAKKGLLSKAWTNEEDEAKKNRLVSAIIEGNEDRVRKLAVSEWNCAAGVIEDLVDLDLGDGYASLSLHAVKQLLPYLEKGLPLTSRDDSPSALKEAGYIRADQKTVHQQKFLPDPLAAGAQITNPLVRHALFEVRKVVNAILRELVYRDGHELATIHVEMAREVKGSGDARKKQSQDMRDRERKRDEIAEKIRTHGVKPTREAITRYLLWDEQHHVCPYSGNAISISQLFGGEIDIDHILPRFRSLDDSLNNRVVCFRAENAQKGDRTPHEWLAQSDPARYEKMLERVASWPYAKTKRFHQPDVSLDDFFARQFVDTAYITTQVLGYIRCLGADVIATKGQHTSELRYHWGLNTVLRDDDLELKNREDHRHHAVDALVIALTTRSRLQQLARIYRQGGTTATGEVLPEPWPQFRDETQREVNQINVSHRVSRKVQGALHEDTFYGPTVKRPIDASKPRPWAKGWIEKEGEFVVRKPVEALTPSMVEEIRDPVIKQLVIERLAKFGIEPGSKKAISKDVWREPLLMKSGMPVKKVRLIRRDQTIRPIRGGAVFVKPGSTHHLCIFEFKDAKGKTIREPKFVSMLEAMDRLKLKQDLIQRTHSAIPEAKFLMSLSSGEMFLAQFNGKERLVVFKTAASTSRQMWFYSHTDARPSANKEIYSAMPNTFQAKKLTIDPIGRIRWAND